MRIVATHLNEPVGPMGIDHLESIAVVRYHQVSLVVMHIVRYNAMSPGSPGPVDIEACDVVDIADIVGIDRCKRSFIGSKHVTAIVRRPGIVGKQSRSLDAGERYRLVYVGDVQDAKASGQI